jgi:hypothetical protein
MKAGNIRVLWMVVVRGTRTAVSENIIRTYTILVISFKGQLGVFLAKHTAVQKIKI